MACMFRLALIVFLVAPEVSARVVFDRARLKPVPSPGRTGPVSYRPLWLKSEGSGEDLEKAVSKIQRASVLLSRTATGRALGPYLAEKGGSVLVHAGGSFYVTDSNTQVSVGPEFINSRTDATAAVFFSHELEHLKQKVLGITGETARGVRELTAFLVQMRVWVELGAFLVDSDLAANWNNAHDLTAALDYPATVMTVLAYRADFRTDLSDPKVRAYWTTVLKEDAVWRVARRSRYPQRNSRESVFFVMNQALNMMRVSGEVSAWLPDVMEKLMSLPRGKTLLLPVEPSIADKALLDAHPLAPLLERGETGSWVLVRP